MSIFSGKMSIKRKATIFNKEAKPNHKLKHENQSDS